jgi:hypothetical protein
MKLFNYFLALVLFCFTSLTFPATVNGRFSVVNMNSSEVSVLLQINTDTGTDDLGGATIVFNMDTSSISFPGNPIKNVDYVFHNFCDGNYSPATVTRPIMNKIWVNIDLPFINNNNGTVVASSPGWTDVVTIHFDIVDPNGTASLSWLTTSLFWGIYDADNSTLWQTGVFENLNGPLPVELVSFTGTLLPNQNILLEWKTASELNHYGFEIERKYAPLNPLPGGEEKGWVTIGFVENQGDPNSLTEYSFIDITPQSFPVVKYRLKSIDNDGTFQYSDIVEVNTLPMSYELSQNYPNPFNPSTKIKYSIPPSGNPLLGGARGGLVTLKVFDILGNEVATLVDEEKEPGIYEVEFGGASHSSSPSGNVRNLPAGGQGLASGIYIYRLQTSEFTDTKKMILLR